MKSLNMDANQKLRLRRTSLALGVAIVHTFICFQLFKQGYFRVTLINFVVLFSLIWCLHLIFPILIITGKNLLLTDPSLTMPQVLWGLTALMITIYFTVELRPLLLMMVFVAFLFGWFHLGWMQFNLIALYTVFSYGFVIFLLYRHYHNLDMDTELLIYLGFILVVICFSMVSAEFIEQREKLKIKNKILEIEMQRLSDQSLHDDLTGITNRRGILNILESQKWLAERYASNYSFSIAAIDLDQFKHINDIYGHAVGDETLRAFCTIAEPTLRKIDFFGRIGGEEFLLIAPYANKEQMNNIAERLREEVQKASLIPFAPDEKITISIGVTLYMPPEGIEETLRRADAALYQAKEQGRNRVIIN